MHRHSKIHDRFSAAFAENWFKIAIKHGAVPFRDRSALRARTRTGYLISVMLDGDMTLRHEASTDRRYLMVDRNAGCDRVDSHTFKEMAEAAHGQAALLHAAECYSAAGDGLLQLAGVVMADDELLRSACPRTAELLGLEEASECVFVL